MTDQALAVRETEEIIEAGVSPVQVPAEEYSVVAIDTTGISQINLTPDQVAILNAPVNDADVRIRPDGQVFLPEMQYRAILTRAFGAGRWALRPVTNPLIRQGLVIQTWALYVNGCFASVATGECQFIESNAQMTYPDVIEGAKSVALRRLCKDLCVVPELWNDDWIAGWRARHCFKVFVKGKKSRVQWRRMSSDPFYGETGLVPDSPNKDKYQKPSQEHQQAAQEVQHDEQDEPANKVRLLGKLVNATDLCKPDNALKSAVVKVLPVDAERKQHLVDFFGVDLVSKLTNEQVVALLDHFNGKDDPRWYVPKDAKPAATSLEPVAIAYGFELPLEGTIKELAETLISLPDYRILCGISGTWNGRHNTELLGLAKALAGGLMVYDTPEFWQAVDSVEVVEHKQAAI